MRNFLALFILYLPVNTFAQTSDYPQNYFRNPLDIPILLAGNFGECRPGHFHSGLDLKTQGKENLPVRAAADGYISRIKMEPGGFGHALYVTHPNGYTTLYAHLNDFKPEVQKHVRQVQYASESWVQDISLKPEQFPVKKGEQIAWSGNTGGSTAPHLHFEIRDSKTEHPLNPQLFGFEVDDRLPPKILKLAIFEMDNGFYQSTPRLFTVDKNDSGYVVKNKLSLGPTTTGPIGILSNEIGLGIVADDYMNGSSNTLAFYTVEWFKDDVFQGRIRLDNIGYDETRYLNAYADYRTKQKGEPWIQCLFRLPGNALSKVYEDLNGRNGLIRESDGEVHKYRIEIKDVFGNASVLNFDLALSPQSNSEKCVRVLNPGKLNRIDTAGLVIDADEKAFYDRVCLSLSREPDSQALSDRFKIGDGFIPVHTPMLLRLKARQNIPFSQRSKVVLVGNDGKKENGTAAKPIGQGSYEARVRSLGEYRLLADTVPPKIEYVGAFKSDMSKARVIQYRIREDLTSVRNVRGELDGKWILFEQHGDVWTYVFDNHCSAGPHQLRLKAEDENGNAAVKELRFVR